MDFTIEETQKIKALKGILASYKTAIVAFSGGIDSTLLCYFSYEVLSDNFLAVTAASETINSLELSQAKELAEEYHWPHLVVFSNEMADPRYTENTPEKCKWCKDIRFKAIKEIADQKGFEYILSGDNVDDFDDYRPGLQHAVTLGMKSPLVEAGFTKNDIRSVAQKSGLSNYNKPSTPCLASRIPYGILLTKEALDMVDQGEQFLKSLGYTLVRVRHHGSLAKIEIPKEQLLNFMSFHADAALCKLKEIGYKYVSLDLQGFRSGSLNEVLNLKNE